MAPHERSDWFPATSSGNGSMITARSLVSPAPISTEIPRTWHRSTARNMPNTILERKLERRDRQRNRIAYLLRETIAARPGIRGLQASATVSASRNVSPDRLESTLPLQDYLTLSELRGASKIAISGSIEVIVGYPKEASNDTRVCDARPQGRSLPNSTIADLGSYQRHVGVAFKSGRRSLGPHFSFVSKDGICPTRRQSKRATIGSRPRSFRYTKAT